MWKGLCRPKVGALRDGASACANNPLHIRNTRLEKLPKEHSARKSALASLLHQKPEQCITYDFNRLQWPVYTHMQAVVQTTASGVRLKDYFVPCMLRSQRNFIHRVAQAEFGRHKHERHQAGCLLHPQQRSTSDNQCPLEQCLEHQLEQLRCGLPKESAQIHKTCCCKHDVYRLACSEHQPVKTHTCHSRRSVVKVVLAPVQQPAHDAEHRGHRELRAVQRAGHWLDKLNKS